MHFTCLYLLKNKTLEEVSLCGIENDFGSRFCYACGEVVPKYKYLCDSFKIGGRWCDLLTARNGIKGGFHGAIKMKKTPNDKFSIAEIHDLKEPINIKTIYCVATLSRVYEDKETIAKFLNKINLHKIDGIVALIDCHD